MVQSPRISRQVEHVWPSWQHTPHFCPELPALPTCTHDSDCAQAMVCVEDIPTTARSTKEEEQHSVTE